jgi:hypothetical protein
MTRRWAIGLLLVVTGCSTVPAKFAPVNPISPSELSHAVFEQVLESHVKDGVVDYPAVQTDDRLQTYLAQLDRVDPNALATRNERLAFWINAYNAFAMKGIVDHDSPASWVLPIFHRPGVSRRRDHDQFV